MGSVWFDTQDFFLLSAPVVFGLSIFRFRARSDLSGAFRWSKMLGNELEAMIGTSESVSHFVISSAKHLPRMRINHVVKHTGRHNRRVLPAMLA